MGTKENPGEFDCYTHAGPDGPTFTLRAKDPLAPITVMMWTALRTKDFHNFANLAATAMNIAKNDIRPPASYVKLVEAMRVSAQMQDWQNMNNEAGALLDKALEEYEANKPPVCPINYTDGMPPLDHSTKG